MAKRILFTVLLLVFAASVSFAYDREPDGFRSIRWGTGFDSVKNEMNLINKNEEGVYFYSRLNDSMKIGNASLKTITYAFGDGKFIYAMIGAEGKNNWDALIIALTSYFGEPTEKTIGGTTYMWYDKKSRKTDIMALIDSSQRVFVSFIGSKEYNAFENKNKSGNGF